MRYDEMRYQKHKLIIHDILCTKKKHILKCYSNKLCAMCVFHGTSTSVLMERTAHEHRGDISTDDAPTHHRRQTLTTGAQHRVSDL